jgi:opacity protein-like surface antigen
MKRVLPVLFLAVTGGLTTGDAAAQRIDSPYRFLDHGQHIGVFAGHVAADEGVLRIGPQPAVTLGARWALRVSGPLSIGAEVAYTPTTRTVRDTAFVAADSLFTEIGEANMRLLSAMANLQFGITGPRTWRGLHPFLLLGIGAVVDLAGASAAEAELPAASRYDFGTSFAGQFGGGVEWYPTQRVSVRLDARNALWRVGAPENFRRTEAGLGLGESEWESNFTLLAGLSFHF